MVKKFVLSLLFLALAAILVLGALNRTTARTQEAVESHDQGPRRSTDAAPLGPSPRPEAGWGQGDVGDGQGRAGRPGDQTGIGQGRTEVSGDQAGTGQAQVEGWLTLQGTVSQVDEAALVVEIEGGQPVSIENRPWWFAQEQGFAVQVGDAVEVVGFYDGDHFEAGRLVNLTTGQEVLLRDESGRPVWAGQGRRAGQAPGR